MKLSFILKISFCFYLLFGGMVAHAQNQIPLADCPKSPNCVCTYGSNERKNMETLPFKGNLEVSVSLVKAIVLEMEGTTLTASKSNYLHFEFSTSIGKFVDDVAFYFDDSNKIIHFRSASRVGYGDFGANKRRMKKIRKTWSKYLVNKRDQAKLDAQTKLIDGIHLNQISKALLNYQTVNY